jgi:hypothetical protein
MTNDQSSRRERHMDMHSATPTSSETRPPPIDSGATSSPLGASAKVWNDLLGFWSGRRAEGANTPPVLTAATDAAEVTVHTYRAILDANQAATTALYEAVQRQHQVVCSAARRQQDLIFTTAQAALSAFEGAGACADGAPQRALTAYRQACGRAIDAVDMLGAAVLGAQGHTPPPTEAQTQAAARR